MTLPKLNSTPKYELTIPSMNKTVRFRPYLVKEEKVLMMAMESQDKKAALNAIVDTIVACIDGKIDKSALTIFDIEYMFIKIRSKSVGEKSTVGIRCTDTSCSHLNEVVVSLDEIEIDRVETNKIIDISEDIRLNMTYPNFLDILRIEDSKLSETEKTFILISKCIDSIVTEEEIYRTKDESEKEVLEFIESFSAEQFSKIREYVENMPRVKKEVDFHCLKCSKENRVYLKGIDDFF